MGEPRGPAPEPDLTRLAAAKFIERHGPAGLRILEERAELADELGHRFAAATWRGLAAAAAGMLGGDRSPAEPAVAATAQLPARMGRRR